jgi:hypothetical protein
MNSLLPDSANYDLAAQLQACQSKSRRNGKVARLPQALRDKINLMLDDGIPYKTIIERLGPPAQHLTEDNLSNWRLGGYQDYLKTIAINQRARIQTEAAADLVRDNGCVDPSKLRQACSQLGLLHYFNTLLHHGDRLTRQSLEKNPAKFITLVNACCNVSNATIALEKHRWQQPADPGADSVAAHQAPAAAPHPK